MIIEFYPNPNAETPKPKPTIVVPVAAPPSPISLEEDAKKHPVFYDFMAKKKNCTVDEFIRREAIVRKHAALIFYRRGDVVYPYTLAEFEQKGKCFVKGIYKTYAEYEGDWPESDNPMIVTAHPMTKPNETFFATAGFFQTFKPLK